MCQKIHPCPIANLNLPNRFWSPTSPLDLLQKQESTGPPEPSELDTQWSPLQDGPLPVISRVISPLIVVLSHL